MILDAQPRGRPSLAVRTNYAEESADGLPRTTFRTHRSPLPSLSPLTTKPLPSPLQPATPAYDVGMRQHERAMVESLDGRSRQGSLGDNRIPTGPLSSIAEQAMAAKVEQMAVESPLYGTTLANQGLSCRATSGRSIVDETRSMLLSGMTASQANNLGTVANRRLSATAEALQKNRRQSLMLIQPDMLQAWGHVYFNDPAKADVFVAPSAMRRRSGSGQASMIEGNRVSIRARIRPKSKDRKPFLLARSFDLEQLRTTLPTTPTTPSSSRHPQPGLLLASDDMSDSARTPTTPVTPGTPGIASGRRRSSAIASGPRVGSHQPKSGAKEMPVHLAYARSYLPALAALMLSGHAKTGDSIDLPMPHPEAWVQTLAYVYTGSGDLTEAVRQNILHLGGRV